MAGVCLYRKIWMYMLGPSRGESFSSEPLWTEGSFYCGDYSSLSLFKIAKTAKIFLFEKALSGKNHYLYFFLSDIGNCDNSKQKKRHGFWCDCWNIVQWKCRNPLNLNMPFCPKWLLLFELVLLPDAHFCLGLVFIRAGHGTVCPSNSWINQLLFSAFSSKPVSLIAGPIPSDMTPQGLDSAMVLQETEALARKTTKPQQVLAIYCHFEGEGSQLYWSFVKITQIAWWFCGWDTDVGFILNLNHNSGQLSRLHVWCFGD